MAAGGADGEPLAARMREQHGLSIHLPAEAPTFGDLIGRDALTQVGARGGVFVGH